MSAPSITASTIPSRRLIAVNTVALVVAYAAPRAVTFAAAIVAARLLGAASFGTYTTAASVAVVASILASAGMHSLLIREIARSPDHAPGLLGVAHLAKLLMIGMMAAALALTPFFGYSPAVAAGAALLGLGYAVGAFVDNLSAYFQGIEQMHVWTQASALLGLVTGVLGIVAVAATGSILWLCATPVAGQLCALAWLIRKAPPAIRKPSVPLFPEVLALLRRLAPFAVTFIATAVYYRADILILAQLRSPTEVGIYGAATRFLDVAQALALAGAGAMLPHFSRSRSAYGSGTMRVLGFAALLSLSGATVLLTFREPIVDALYGQEYASAGPLLVLVAPTVIGRTINMFALAALAGADLIRLAGGLYSAAAVASIVLNLLAIPAFGAVAAAGVSLLTESLLAVALAFVLWKRRER